MSTTMTPPSTAIDVSGTSAVPFSRLVAVELRKMFDTRAGRWLIGITVGLQLVAMVVALLVVVLNDLPMSFDTWVQILAVPLSLLLPAVAIMSITQEWGQRTGLVTFALEPNRIRVVLAKLLCVLVLALATIAFAALMAVVGNVLYDAFSDGSAGWSIDGGLLGWTIALQLAFFVMAFGFGMVFLSTPTAIVLYYVVSLLLPMMVYGPLMALVGWGPDVVPWVDLGIATSPFYAEVPKPDLAEFHVASNVLLWVVLPFAVGLRRIRRVELK